MKHLKISCQKHKIDSLLLSSRCMTNYIKSCSFLHVHFFDLMKVQEVFHVYLNKFENAVTHLFLVILGNN